MPNYVLPTFNLAADVRTAGVFVGAPRLTVNVNLSPGNQVMVPSAVLVGTGIYMQVRVAVGTDVRDSFNATGEDSIEVPAGSGRFYLCRFVDDIGKGFANEHRLVLCQKASTWPTPIP